MASDQYVVGTDHLALRLQICMKQCRFRRRVVVEEITIAEGATCAILATTLALPRIACMQVLVSRRYCMSAA